MRDIRNRGERRQRRHERVRRAVCGTAERPRLAVFKSAKHIVAQVIDDVKGHTLCTAGTLTPGLREQLAGVKPLERAKRVGAEVARLAKEKGVAAIVFDRGGFPYLGRVRALAEAARQAGLKF